MRGAARWGLATGPCSAEARVLAVGAIYSTTAKVDPGKSCQEGGLGYGAWKLVDETKDKPLGTVYRWVRAA